MSGERSDEPARGLDTREWIRDERVIGLGALTPAEAGPAISAPRRETLWKLGRLSVPLAEGEPIADPQRRQAAVADLRRHTGAAWLEDDIADAVIVVDHLVAPEVRARYAEQGMQIAWDDPGDGYYSLVARVAGRHVQCTGQVDQWLACFVAAPLSRDQAMEGNRPRPRPLQALEVVAPVLPRAAALSWQPREPGVPASVIDTYLHSGEARLWAGVRARGPMGDGERFLYGVRVNLPR